MVRLPLASHLAFLEFYSFPLLRFLFSVCVFIIIIIISFQDEKENTQQMGILQEVQILFFLFFPQSLGRGGLFGDPSLEPCSQFCDPHWVMPQPLPFALDHVAPFACTQGRHLSSTYGSCATVAHPPSLWGGIIIYHSAREKYAWIHNVRINSGIHQLARKILFVDIIRVNK